MKTRNKYNVPLKQDNIIRKDTSSPAHKGPLKHAVDFLCVEGTRIYAALDGKVVEVVNDKKEGGADRPLNDAGNSVLIKHENGEFSHYAHFRPSGVVVKVGEVLRMGDLLGYSGNTGFSFGPHLHFSVIRFKGQSSKDFESLEIRLR